MTTGHEIALTGLTPGTRNFYAVGSTTQIFDGTGPTDGALPVDLNLAGTATNGAAAPGLRISRTEQKRGRLQRRPCEPVPIPSRQCDAADVADGGERGFPARFRQCAG